MSAGVEMEVNRSGHFPTSCGFLPCDWLKYFKSLVIFHLHYHSSYKKCHIGEPFPFSTRVTDQPGTFRTEMCGKSLMESNESHLVWLFKVQHSGSFAVWI